MVRVSREKRGWDSVIDKVADVLELDERDYH